MMGCGFGIASVELFFDGSSGGKHYKSGPAITCDPAYFIPPAHAVGGGIGCQTVSAEQP